MEEREATSVGEEGLYRRLRTYMIAWDFSTGVTVLFMYCTRLYCRHGFINTTQLTHTFRGFVARTGQP